jgi:hypothetical protein
VAIGVDRDDGLGGLGDVVELVDIFDRSDHFGAFQNDGKETDRKLTNSSTSPKFPPKFPPIRGKLRLFLEAKAQTVQVTESRWYRSDRILATGEVQVAYRLLKADGSLEKSCIILKASKADDTRIDELSDLDWQRPLAK